MNKVEIYIPTLQKTGDKVNNWAELLAEAQESFANAYGGCTTVKGSGAWLDAQLKLVSEAVWIVYSFTDRPIATCEMQLAFLGHRIKEKANQDSVMTVINNEPTFWE